MINKVNKTFKVSVIIPVYNAEKYVSKAIESALSQEKVGEIIVVDDGSSDNSLTICKNFEKQYNKVRVLHHSDKQNHGAGASRNLGIKNGRYNYIAFLDADDYYLPHRFERDEEILSDDDIDGVYHALGTEYYGQRSTKLPSLKNNITTVTKYILPSDLFESMAPVGNKGHFSCDTLTVKRRVFDKTGFFNHFKIGEDTFFCAKLAASCRLVGGRIKEPVAIRGIHQTNMINNETELNKARYHVLQALLQWGIDEKSLSSDRINLLLSKLYYIHKSESNEYINDKILKLRVLLNLALKYPKLLNYKCFYSHLPGIGRILFL